MILESLGFVGFTVRMDLGGALWVGVGGKRGIGVGVGSAYSSAMGGGVCGEGGGGGSSVVVVGGGSGGGDADSVR